MAATDNPLQQLVEAFAEDFAAWLLRAEVREVHALNVELLASPTRVDQLLRLTLATGRAVKLHIEFQGIRSGQPMPRRMLDYAIQDNLVAARMNCRQCLTIAAKTAFHSDLSIAACRGEEFVHGFPG